MKTVPINTLIKEFDLLKQALDNQYLYLVEQKIQQTESDQPIDVAASLVAFLHGHISATQFLYSQGGEA